MKHTFAHLGVLAVLLSTSAAARGESLWPLEQRVNASLGAFLFDTDTRIRVDATNEDRGTQIDMENAFGFDDQDRLRLDGYWRFAKRHKLRFMYFTSRASSQRTLSDDVEFQDMTFPVDAVVQAEFDTDVIELAYEYAFVRTPSFELAGAIGVHNLEINARLSAEASSVLGAGGIDRRASAKANGPLPVFGLHAIWAASDKLYVDLQAQLFALEVDEYDGSLQDYKISLTWQPVRNFGIGIGYNAFLTEVDVDGQHFIGRLRFGYDGPLAFVSVAF